jgi:hypothetical protein
MCASDLWSKKMGEAGLRPDAPVPFAEHAIIVDAIVEQHDQDMRAALKLARELDALAMVPDNFDAIHQKRRELIALLAVPCVFESGGTSTLHPAVTCRHCGGARSAHR